MEFDSADDLEQAVAMDGTVDVEGMLIKIDVAEGRNIANHLIVSFFVRLA